jgi:hypothetical protein
MGGSPSDAVHHNRSQSDREAMIQRRDGSSQSRSRPSGRRPPPGHQSGTVEHSRLLSRPATRGQWEPSRQPHEAAQVWSGSQHARLVAPYRGLPAVNRQRFFQARPHGEECEVCRGYRVLAVVQEARRRLRWPPGRDQAPSRRTPHGTVGEAMQRRPGTSSLPWAWGRSERYAACGAKV